MNSEEFKQTCLSSYEEKVGQKKTDFWNETKRKTDEYEKYLLKEFPVIKPLDYKSVKTIDKPFPACLREYDLCGFRFISVFDVLIYQGKSDVQSVRNKADFGKFLVWAEENKNYDI